MMYQEGLTTRDQLENFKKKINDLKGAADEILVKFNVSYDNKAQDLFDFFCDDIILQAYKYGDIAPGELVKITSMVTPPWGLEAYVTRDENGTFGVVLQNPRYGYNLLDPYYSPSLPFDHLITHMHYLMDKFQQSVPPHLQRYAVPNYKLYAEALGENKNNIRDLELGDELIIPASASRKYPLHIIKATNAEYHVLLETGNPEEPYIQLNKNEKVVWKMDQGVLLDQDAIAFLERTRKARDKVARNDVPNQLIGLIYKADLLKMYDYILNNPSIITKLASGKEFRVGKSAENGLPRTMNIVRDQNGEMMLMLETKSKLASGKKDKQSRVIGAGSFGTVKPAWRIDTAVPEEWANKSMVGEKTLEADYEAIFSQRLLESIPDKKSANQVVNITLLGELFTSKENVKRSQYSKRAIGDLESVLKDPKIHLTAADKERITRDVLEGIALLHSQGKVHQDIKAKNIFIYRDNKGGYYAKVADFGISCDLKNPKEEALASARYESPEILHAHSDARSSHHNYYHNTPDIKSKSYGYKQYLQNPPDPSLAQGYRAPHPANDMWALGIVFYQLENGINTFPTEDTIKNASSLVQGLLKPRENRLDVTQARAQYEQQVSASRAPQSVINVSDSPPRPPSIVLGPPELKNIKRGIPTDLLGSHRNIEISKVVPASKMASSKVEASKLEPSRVEPVAPPKRAQINVEVTDPSQIKNQLIETILSMNVKELYLQLRNEKMDKPSSKPIGWLLKSVRIKDSSLSKNEGKREQQVVLLQNLLQELTTHPDFKDKPIKQVQAAYYILSKMSEYITIQERNPHSGSPLKQLCDSKCEELVGNFPQDLTKIESLPLSSKFKDNIQNRIASLATKPPSLSHTRNRNR